jgi:uncharacterized protein YoaH (UPF0181 family)
LKLLLLRSELAHSNWQALLEQHQALMAERMAIFRAIVSIVDEIVEMRARSNEVLLAQRGLL